MRKNFLSNADNADEVYINQVLPEKMNYNLQSIEEFSFWRELAVMLQTLIAVVKKDK